MDEDERATDKKQRQQKYFCIAYKISAEAILGLQNRQWHSSASHISGEFEKRSMQNEDSLLIAVSF